MSDSDELPKKRDLTRHPLTSIVVGFLLSGVLGGLLTNFYSNQQAERDEIAKIAALRKEATEAFARFVYERRTRAEMLASSLRRKAPVDEVIDRKKLYDEAFAKWGTNLQANLFSVRDILEASSYSDFESHIEHKLIPAFRSVDSCLTSAYDRRIVNDDPSPVLEACSMTSQLQLVLDCGYAITDELFKLSAPSSDGPTKDRAQQRDDANAEISTRCTPKTASNQTDL